MTDSKKKTLVVINGVTGTLGSACLARFSRERDTDIVGLSRKAKPAQAFSKDGVLMDIPIIICSIGDDISDTEACESFAQRINANLYDKVIYIHAVGEFPVELDEQGNIQVAHDEDGDGIDDRVMKLSHDAFFAMAQALRGRGLPTSALILGSIADKHRLAVHQSWWKTMEKIKEHMHQLAEGDLDISLFVLNISSVVCPHEILERPFVFRDTNAKPRFWLMSSEVAERINMLVSSEMKGVIEDELFHKAEYFDENYYEEEGYTDRRRSETGRTGENFERR